MRKFGLFLWLLAFGLGANPAAYQSEAFPAAKAFYEKAVVEGSAPPDLLVDVLIHFLEKRPHSCTSKKAYEFAIAIAQITRRAAAEEYSPSFPQLVRLLFFLERMYHLNSSFLEVSFVGSPGHVDEMEETMPSHEQQRALDYEIGELVAKAAFATRDAEEYTVFVLSLATRANPVDATVQFGGWNRRALFDRGRRLYELKFGLSTPAFLVYAHEYTSAMRAAELNEAQAAVRLKLRRVDHTIAPIRRVTPEMPPGFRELVQLLMPSYGQSNAEARIPAGVYPSEAVLAKLAQMASDERNSPEERSFFLAGTKGFRGPIRRRLFKLGCALGLFKKAVPPSEEK